MNSTQEHKWLSKSVLCKQTIYRTQWQMKFETVAQDEKDPAVDVQPIPCTVD